MTKTGAQTLIDTLLDKGIEYVFGIPGGVVLPLFDTLYDSPIKFILMRHEQAAGHAADGFARATGKVGVCMVTSGPGATNLTTAIATAFMDSVPIVAITGQVKTNLIGSDAFQEADVMGIMRPITKHSYLVKNSNDLPRVLNEALYIASTGRCGPVVIDLPVDVTMQSTNSPAPEDIDLPGYKPRYDGTPRQRKLAAEATNDSQRPVLYTGGGIILSGCAKELLALAEKAHIPVTTTLMGLGGFPETNPLSLGMLGMHGTGYANNAVQESDLLIAVGSRFDDRVTGKLDEFA
ncbi:MAG: thiamine pyrophosphate-binding protein, partial [Candidatus Brocadiales bacterium]